MSIEALDAWAAAWTAPLGHALLDFVWQGAAIAACAWWLLHGMRNARPQARYVVACLALIACLLFPLSGVWRLRTGAIDADTRSAAGIVASAVESAPNTGVVGLWSAIFADDAKVGDTGADDASSIEAVLPWVVAMWSVGAVLMLIRMLAGLFWIERLRRGAAKATDTVGEALLRRFDELRIRIGIRRRIGFLTIAHGRIVGIGPIAAGIVAPVVILPTALLARMPSDLLEALLAHELAHIRRHDYLINLLQTLVEAVLFYHPAVWWLSRRIRHERELIADDLAAHALGAPRTLARALAELDRLQAEDDLDAEHDIAARPMPRFPLTLSQAARGGSLMSRIQTLTQPKRPMPVLGLALPSVGLTAIALACLAYAQSDRPQASSSTAATKPASQASVPQRAALPTPHATPLYEKTGVAGLALRGKTDSDSDELREGYAIVRAGEEGFSMSGNLDDIDRIRAAKARIRDDFIWFRRDGQAYVVRDAATLARVRAAWRVSEANEAKMRALSAEMEGRSVAVETLANTLSTQAQKRATEHQQRSDEHNLRAKQALASERLAERQAALSVRHAQNSRHHEDDHKREWAAHEAEMAALDREMEALDREMEAMEADMQAHNASIDAEIEASMSALESELEAATEPLDTLGAQMQALSSEQEKIMLQVDREIAREIERALRENLAEPAPDAKTRR
jgi:beta-lactamase regulating signal transducer with metallopeptidase domain